MTQLTPQRMAAAEAEKAKTVKPEVINYCEYIKEYCGANVKPCEYYTETTNNYFNVEPASELDRLKMERAGLTVEANGVTRLAVTINSGMIKHNNKKKAKQMTDTKKIQAFYCFNNDNGSSIYKTKEGIYYLDYNHKSEPLPFYIGRRWQDDPSHQVKNVELIKTKKES